MCGERAGAASDCGDAVSVVTLRTTFNYPPAVSRLTVFARAMFCGCTESLAIWRLESVRQLWTRSGPGTKRCARSSRSYCSGGLNEPKGLFQARRDDSIPSVECSEMLAARERRGAGGMFCEGSSCVPTAADTSDAGGSSHRHRSDVPTRGGLGD